MCENTASACQAKENGKLECVRNHYNKSSHCVCEVAYDSVALLRQAKGYLLGSNVEKVGKLCSKLWSTPRKGPPVEVCTLASHFCPSYEMLF